MASIYFYYNELLQQGADTTIENREDVHGAWYSGKQDCQQQQAGLRQNVSEEQGKDSNKAEKSKSKENQEENCVMRMPVTVTKRAYTQATLAALQPRMNRLAYLQPSAVPNLDVLARSLGPQL